MQQYGALEKLQRILGYQFNDAELLMLALTHRSMKGQHNERLEYLGDAVLGMVVAERLYKDYPRQTEGKLTRMRASLVKGDTLAKVAKRLQLGDYLQLGPGELKSGGQRRNSILADAVEAILGAIYLDADMDTARQCVFRWLAEEIEQLDPETSSKDAKTRLQEYLQGRGEQLPEYHVTDISGAEHNQTFVVECRVAALDSTFSASGASRRKAEQKAAALALKEIAL